MPAKSKQLGAKAPKGILLPTCRSKGRKPSTKRKQQVPLSARVFKLELRVFKRICEDVNTPRSLSCWLLAHYGEWSQYVSLPPPDQHQASFPDDYLVTEIMRKNPRIPLGVDREAAAIEKFLMAEQLCEDTNRRFEAALRGEFPNEEARTRMFRARDIFGRLLPSLSRTDRSGTSILDKIVDAMRHGSGATTSVAGERVLPSNKMTCICDVTPKLHPFVRSLRGPHWSNVSPVQLRAYGEVLTVPKDAKTERTIIKEVHMNLVAQLGIGAMLKRVLNSLGLDVNHQTRNQNLARLALTLDLATVDLSMASDTVAYSAVEFLTQLRPDWFHLLDITRTPFAEMPDGTLHPLEKFSSMGNGYTWELETLIFYTLCRCVCSSTDEIGVYGDDIIVPRDKVGELAEYLKLFGFRMNHRKSHWQGVFRESCGSDYWFGRDVRPFYFRKDEYHDLDQAAIHMANSIRHYAHRRNDAKSCDRRFLRSWLLCVGSCSKRGKVTAVSYGTSDDGLIRNFDECSPAQQRWRHSRGFEGYRGVILRRSPLRSSKTDPYGAYLTALWKGTPLELTTRECEFRPRRVRRAALRSVLCQPAWYNLGPWVTRD